MIELLGLLSRRQTPLENDIVFMFNGGTFDFFVFI